MNYDNKKFSAVSNTENGETSAETIFHYRQQGNVLFADYCGGKIVKGHLIGLVADGGTIDMRYHQVNTAGEIMTGVCKSIPEILANGKIRLYEEWQWTSGNLSKGKSIIEEL